jgi:hypothetical protein
MSLIERNILWFLPAVPLLLFAVHAMMQFAMTWFAVPPRRVKRTFTAAELRAALVRLNRPDRPWRLEPATNRDFNVRWRVVDDSWRQRFVRVIFTSHYSLRLLLDEGRREVRQQESLRSSYFFVGRQGFAWRMHFSMNYYAGMVNGIVGGRAYGLTKLCPPDVAETSDYSMDTDEVKREVRKLARSAGWSVRPVILWFDASRWGVAVSRWLVPPPLNSLRPKTLWAIFYPLSYAVAVGYLAVIANVHTLSDIGLLLLITAAWFGVSGGIIALLARSQRPSKKRRRRRAA